MLATGSFPAAWRLPGVAVQNKIQPASGEPINIKKEHLMPAPKPLFAFLPVSLFGSVMGLSGLTAAWQAAALRHGLPEWIFRSLAVFTVFTFVLLLLCYGLKAITAFGAVKAEFNHPVSKSFFGTVCISLLLLPLVIFDHAPQLAYFIWMAGVVLMLLFAVYMVGFWLSHQHEQTHVTPAWIIPVVGTLDIPLAAGLFDGDFYWLNLMALSIGLFFTFPLLTLILSRLIFFDKMPQKLMPSLMILVAPFAVGALAYQQTLQADSFMVALYCIGLFFFVVLLPQLFRLAHACPFRVGWWAISFPLAALLNATFKISDIVPGSMIKQAALLMLFAFSLVFIWLLVRSLSGIFKGELANLV